MGFVGYLAYAIVRGAMVLLAKTLWHTQVTGRENVPSQGAFLLSPVHRANIDGPLAATFTGRRMRYLAKEGMFKVPWFAKLIISMGAIRVNRGAPDRHSLKLCLDELQAGHPLVLFPEGTRKSGPQVAEVMEGAAYLALRAGVPVVPVGIANSDVANPKGKRLFRPARIRVVIGEPISFEKPAGTDRVPRSAVKAGTEVIHERLQALYDEAKRAAAS